MNIDVTQTGDTLLVRIGDSRLDATVALRFRERMRELAAETPAQRVVIDLSRVGFMDSSGLGAVVATMKLLAPARRMELAGLTSSVERVFRLTRMDSVFRIHRSVEDVGLGQPQ
jgi:anti-sigma B factor antagonist